MKRDVLTERIARQTRTSRAEAADGLDTVVHQLIRNLRAGKRAELPGLGNLGRLTVPKPPSAKRGGKP
jgi:nucleoid DNA-binding protein